MAAKKKKPVVLDAALAPLGKAFAPDATVTHFNAHSLCVKRKVFAMLVKEDLAVKLAPERAAALVEAGRGRPHQVGALVMKGWFVSPVAHQREWVALAREARKFVSPG